MEITHTKGQDCIVIKIVTNDFSKNPNDEWPVSSRIHPVI
jgi:hypothetical protein